MIITQTPLRIGLLGGGTDLPSYYLEHGGRVLNCAIDKYIYVIVKQRFDDEIYVNYSKKEIVSRVADIEHELVREAMLMTGVTGGVEITTLADIPSSGSGLGSSSAVTVGLLHALYAYTGRQVSAEELAEGACRIEIERCGKPIGKQDQYIAALGGIRDLRFGPGEDVSHEELGLSASERVALQQQMMLFYTGITRRADNILAEQNANVSGHPAAARPAPRPGRVRGQAAAQRRRGRYRAGAAGELGSQAEAGLRRVELAGGRRGHPGARGRRLWREADRGGRRRFPRRAVSHGAAARRPRKPGRHAGTADQARAVRLTRHAQRRPRHLELTT